ncbi:MAG: hypothetical protein ACLP2P_09860 [Desulfobaccales bacterium]
MFRDPALEDYLRVDKENMVVFNDYACMEAYKGSGIESIYRSIEIVSKYPDQVIILKGTRDVAKLTLSPSGSYRLEDSAQTKGFKAFCIDVEMAFNGNEILSAEVLRKRQLAYKYTDTNREDANKIIEAIKILASSFQPVHLKAIRKREKLQSEVIDKIVGDILWIAAFLFQAHPDIFEMPQVSNLKNTYIFRFAISIYLLSFHWISDGGPGNISREKLRNHVTDMIYVAYATFFDGLLTRDKKMQQIYQEACFFLEELFPSE